MRQHNGSDGITVVSAARDGYLRNISAAKDLKSPVELLRVSHPVVI